MGDSHEEENAAELKLPAVFLEANALSNTEAKIVLEHHLEARGSTLDAASDRVRKTYEYVSQFNIQQNRPNMDALRQKLASSYPKLVHFEICVLANLAPGDPEEATLMIPSLVGKVSPEDLAQIVEEVALYR